MKVFHRVSARSKRGAAVGVLAASLLASVLGLAPSAHAIDVAVGCSASDLRAAVNAANAVFTPDTISLQPGCTYTFDSPTFGSDAAMVVNNGPLTIYGNGAKIVVAPGNFSLRHFDVTGGILTLNNVTLSGGHIVTAPTNHSPMISGSILVDGGALVGDKLTVKHNKVRAIDLAVDAAGGGIVSNGSTTLTRSTIVDNDVEAFGVTAAVGVAGGILAPALDMTDSSVKGNDVDLNATVVGEGTGGGIFSFGGVTIDSSSVTGNSVEVGAGLLAAAAGGGIYNDGDLTILQSKVSGNKSSASGAAAVSAGGGIANDANGILIVDTPTTESDDASVIKDNKATCTSSFCAALGGGTYSEGPSAYWFTLFKGNVASAKKGGAAGGGLAVVGSTTTLHEATVTKNSATGKVAVGGGIARLAGVVVIDASDIFKNKPDNCFNVLGC